MTARHPRRQTWTKAQQRALKQWEKKHPFKNKGFPKGKGHSPTPVNHGGPPSGTVFPGAPMITAGRHGAGRHGHGRHGLAVAGQMPLCAALAVAESLLNATGVAASENDLLALHAAAGGDGEGAPLASVLAVAAERGLAGHRPLSITPSSVADGTVVSLALELAQEAQPAWDAEPSPFWGLHAGWLTGDHVLTWGRAIPVTAGFLECQALAAWRVTWT